MGRNLLDFKQKNEKDQINQIQPKSDKFKSHALAKKNQTPSTNLIKKNLDDYIFSLSNFELKQKLDSCPGKLGECPLLTEFREGLRKSISNHLNLTEKNESRLCKTSRNHVPTKDCYKNFERENMRMLNLDSNDSGSEKRGAVKDVKSTCSNTSRSVIRSTRAQDLRSQSNRDLLRPKTMTEKARTVSPYVTALPVKKKKCSTNENSEEKTTRRSNPSKATEEKKKKQISKQISSANDKMAKFSCREKSKKAAGENIPLQRQKTQEIINPKIVKKNGRKVAAGDYDPPQLKKSQTFFICKGAKNSDGSEKSLPAATPPDSTAATDTAAAVDCGPGDNVSIPMDSISDGNVSDEDVVSPKPKPLTHNDSFCLIAKSSQQWSQKNRSDDEKWLQYDLDCDEEKSKRTNDKGILKNANYDLKSVDSLEKIDSEKIVRFSDEITRNKKVLKKLVRRKKRIQNLFAPSWYQRNKFFQKYLQILREKSVLLSDQIDVPEDLKPFRVPIKVKERYEAEMFGLLAKNSGGKSHGNSAKDAYSY